MVTATARAEGARPRDEHPTRGSACPASSPGSARPSFPDRDFPVTDFGAVADGTTDATAAFRAAIDACARAGGGRVVVPPGVFLTGPIHLRSNVNLHVSEGATIRFSRDPARLPAGRPTRWEGVELMGLLAARLRLRAARHRDHRQGHARRPGGRRALVAVEEERPPAEPEARPRPAVRAGRGRRARSPSASTAPATTCGPSSSSPTAARTSSSRASRSRTPRCG